MRITKRSITSGKEHTMEINVTPEQLKRWQGGALIQNVMPHLSTWEREFLINGTTKEEWDALFGKG